MSRGSRMALAVGVASLLVAKRGHVGRFLRTLDQRGGIFAPRGARLYTAIAPRILRPLYRRVAEEVAGLPELTGISGMSSVLEIGSGPGELAMDIARRARGAQVVGIDLAPAMIERSSDRARAAMLDQHLRFVLADAASLPLPDGAFDVAVSTLSLHHWSDPPAVFREIERILRPGGVALIYDLRPFAYLRPELDVFLAGTVFQRAHMERDLVKLGPFPALFVRIRLDKPAEA